MTSVQSQKQVQKQYQEDDLVHSACLDGSKKSGTNDCINKVGIDAFNRLGTQLTAHTTYTTFHFPKRPGQVHVHCAQSPGNTCIHCVDEINAIVKERLNPTKSQSSWYNPLSSLYNAVKSILPTSAPSTPAPANPHTPTQQVATPQPVPLVPVTVATTPEAVPPQHPKQSPVPLPVPVPVAAPSPAVVSPLPAPLPPQTVSTAPLTVNDCINKNDKIKVEQLVKNYVVGDSPFLYALKRIWNAVKVIFCVLSDWQNARYIVLNAVIAKTGQEMSFSNIDEYLKLMLQRLSREAEEAAKAALAKKLADAEKTLAEIKKYSEQIKQKLSALPQTSPTSAPLPITPPPSIDRIRDLLPLNTPGKLNIAPALPADFVARSQTGSLNINENTYWGPKDVLEAYFKNPSKLSQPIIGAIKGPFAQSEIENPDRKQLNDMLDSMGVSNFKEVSVKWGNYPIYAVTGDIAKRSMFMAWVGLNDSSGTTIQFQLFYPGANQKPNQADINLWEDFLNNTKAI